MKTQSTEEKLEKINKALARFYDTDIEALLCRYRDYLDQKESKNAEPELTDKKTAVEYFGKIPDYCYQDKPIEMKNEMLKSLTKEDLLNLCEEQVKTHPGIEKEIRSMFEYCLKIKKLIES